MEAERMAAEAPPELDRTAPAPAAPDLAPLQRAPAEYVRRLSRTHGNRRVGLALQRQPATAAPPIAKGYKPVSTDDLRWQKVDDLLTWTPLVRVRLLIANPGGRASPELGPPGGVGESYEDFYAREFKQSPHTATPP